MQSRKTGSAHWSEASIWKAVGPLSGLLALSWIYLPILWLIVMSVSAEPLSGFPGPFTSRHYAELFVQSGWVAPLMHSFWLAFAVALVSMICATMIGRAVPRLRRGGLPITAVVLLPLMVPGVVIGTAMFLYLRVFLGFKLGLWSLFAGHFVWAFPFSLLAVLVVSFRFDTRLLDAAADLGSGPWERFWRIEVPLLKDGIIAGGLFAFLLSFNEIARSIYLKGKVETLPVYLWQQASSHSSTVPLIFPLNVIILLASAVLVGVAFWLLFHGARHQESQR
ncbi:ABC transporter permease [Nitratireductor aquibiodomus]|uniref:ABC transporter permease n=1 Tax=Nitratireductor aquibiodomus TaxID=204799 RepID=UPI000467F9C9|nr:ABC transporter permease subunit [Nitratireductor aquibiodomus]